MNTTPNSLRLLFISILAILTFALSQPRCYQDSHCSLWPCYKATWCNTTRQLCEIIWKECPQPVDPCFDVGCAIDGTCVESRACQEPNPNTCQTVVCSRDPNGRRCTYPPPCPDADECSISYCNTTTNACYYLVDKSRPACLAEPTDEVCNFYKGLDWVSPAYRDNAFTACRETGNDPTMNCVRSFLQRALNSPKRYPEEKKQHFRDLMYLSEVSELKRHVPFATAFQQSIYQDHVDAYKACGCPGTPAGQWAWSPISMYKLLVGTTTLINLFGPCDGKSIWQRFRAISDDNSEILLIPVTFPPNLDVEGAITAWVKMRELVVGSEPLMGMMLIDYNTDNGNATVAVVPWQGINFSITDRINVASSSGELATLGIEVPPSFVFPPMSPIAPETTGATPGQSANPSAKETSATSNVMVNRSCMNVVIGLIATTFFLN